MLPKNIFHNYLFTKSFSTGEIDTTGPLAAFYTISKWFWTSTTIV